MRNAIPLNPLIPHPILPTSRPLNRGVHFAQDDLSYIVKTMVEMREHCILNIDIRIVLDPDERAARIADHVPELRADHLQAVVLVLPAHTVDVGDAVACETAWR